MYIRMLTSVELCMDVLKVNRFKSEHFPLQIAPTTLQLVYQLQLSVKEYNELINKLLVDLLATHRTMCKLSSVLFAVFATIFSKVRV